MGIVEELGEGVTLLKKGDRVVMPFNVADGRCRNCEEGKTAFCTGVNPGFAGGAYGKLPMTLRRRDLDRANINKDMLPWDHTGEASLKRFENNTILPSILLTGPQAKHSI